MNDITYYGKNKEPLIIVEKNFYTKNELDGIWQELNFLTYEHKLYPPNRTNSAVDTNGRTMKKNSGIFLTELYTGQKVGDHTLDSMMYIVVAGLGFTASEKFSKKD
mgnify:CR=1 FL=1